MNHAVGILAYSGEVNNRFKKIISEEDEKGGLKNYVSEIIIIIIIYLMIASVV
jgi:hypothetical protein